VIRLIITFLLQIIISTFVFGQKDIENGKYFYHKENTSGDFFDQPKFQIDSIQFFYSKSGDTLMYWTVGMSTPYGKKELKKIEKQKEFGKYLQRGLTLSDGRVTVHNLRPTKFFIRNDSLFQWNEVYRISKDSIMKLKTVYESGTTTQDRERVSKVIKDDTDFRFVFIFSGNLFDKGLEQIIHDKWTKCPNTVTLLSKWSTDKTDYYRFEITNDCGIWGHRWGYIVSREFDFLTFGGYSSKESKELTKTTLKVSNQSEY
jgi:hypothetical protein